MKYEILYDDILNWAKNYTGPKMHAMICDPPYHLTSKPGGKGGFMGKSWDGGDIAFRPETWSALSEHLLPGAHIMAFGGSRTFHRLACAIEDAGFELRETILFCHGMGFPKSANISLNIDKEAGATRDVIGQNQYASRRPSASTHSITGFSDTMGGSGTTIITAPSTNQAKIWNGYGTALKPALEPIIVAMKPIEGTFAQNCVKYGSGALNIDGSRIATEDNNAARIHRNTNEYLGVNQDYHRPGSSMYVNKTDWAMQPNGRFPSNLILDNSPEVLAMFPETNPSNGSVRNNNAYEGCAKGKDKAHTTFGHEDNGGSAARFFHQVDYALDQADPIFYTAKASRAERDAGCEALAHKDRRTLGCGLTGVSGDRSGNGGEVKQIEMGNSKVRNNHPCVKPISLCKYLSTLLLPPTECAPRRILVPFAGSSSEMIGCILSGWDEVIGIEREAEYIEIAKARLKFWHEKHYGTMFVNQEEDF